MLDAAKGLEERGIIASLPGKSLLYRLRSPQFSGSPISGDTRRIGQNMPWRPPSPPPASSWPQRHDLERLTERNNGSNDPWDTTLPPIPPARFHRNDLNRDRLPERNERPENNVERPAVESLAPSLSPKGTELDKQLDEIIDSFK